MLLSAALDYNLDESLIATRPAEPRESARLMVLSRSDPHRLEHLHIAALPELLGPEHALVFNRTRVLPARFVGRNIETGGHVEGLWLHDRTDRPAPAWEAYIKARRFRPGREVELNTHDGRRSGVVLRLVEKTSADGAWLVDLTDPRDRTTPEILDEVGLTPLPPYIRGARKRVGLDISDETDRGMYQTVFAGMEEEGPVQGSVAAPTAGLHFTTALLERLERSGVLRAEVTLHVGAGTFKPIEAEHVEEHQMHAEWCRLGEGASVMESSRRVIAVGSTSARTLESFARRALPRPEWLSTDLLIAPGYEWKRVDGMLTNFHLPRSTLLAMVAGFLPGGIEQLMSAYRIAMERGYRFYSYGDAMLILP